jgi:hypothetical protein
MLFPKLKRWNQKGASPLAPMMATKWVGVFPHPYRWRKNNEGKEIGMF